MSNPANYNVTIESVDRAIRDWFDKSVDARVDSPNGLHKVPVYFSSGERWAVGRTKQGFRDENGVLILPVISLRRVSIDPDPAMTSLACQVPSIQFARRVDPKTSDVRNQGYKGSVYDVYTIPFPNGVIAEYQLVVQTQFISQMNQILEKLWKTLDILKQFLAPINNDGRQQTPRDLQEQNVKTLIKYPYVVGFLDSAAADGGNFEEFTDQERIVKYQTDIKVPFVLQTEPEGQGSSVKVERTAYKVVLRDEQWHFVDDPEDLDDVFGPPTPLDILRPR